MNCASIRILGDRTQGTVPAVILRSEGETYLFNCPAGFQRLCITQAIKMDNLKNIFLTRLNWSNLSGGHGLALTLTARGNSECYFYATKGIEDFIKCSLTFMQIVTDIKLGTRTLPTDTLSTPGVQIEPVIIENPTKVTNTSVNAMSHPLVAYLCKLPPVLGALNPTKCRELNVPMGPMLAKLKYGEDVTLADGSLIKSSDVCEPTKPGPYFIILECPTNDHISWFKNNSRLNEVRSIERTSSDTPSVDFVIHLSPREVCRTSSYKDWMDGFHGECKHFVISEDPKTLNLIAFYRNNHLLGKIDEMLYPKTHFKSSLDQSLKTGVELEFPWASLKSDNPSSELNSWRNYSEHDYELPEGERELHCFDTIHLKPKKYLKCIDNPIWIDILSEHRLKDFPDDLQRTHDAQKKLAAPKDYEPEVIFLGTASSVPGLFRNLSGILVNLYYPRMVSVIYDCGEDTYGQLLRYYGPLKVQEILKQLKVIIISHHHADHHLGLTELIVNRRAVTDKPLVLVIPPFVENVLKFHNNNIEDLSKSYVILPSSEFIHKRSNDQQIKRAKATKSSIYQETGGLITELKAVFVDHCLNANAFVTTFEIGHPEMKSFTLSYSGDCRPSKDFTEIGKHSDLLIHEATFDSWDLEDAIAKKHSTSEEAIEVSRAMEAKFTILTHFSSKVSRLTRLPENSGVGLAHDFLTVRCPSDKPRLLLMNELMLKVFQDSIEKAEKKASKRSLRRELVGTFDRCVKEKKQSS